MRKLIKTSRLVTLAIFTLLIMTTGIAQSDHSIIISRVFRALQPEGAFSFSMTYQLFADSLSKKALVKERSDYWKLGNTTVMRGNNNQMVQISNDEDALTIDHELKTMVLNHANKVESDRFGPDAWDRMLGDAINTSLTEQGSIGLLSFHYPWSSSVSAVTLTYQLANYQPKKAVVYSRMPLEYAHNEWASSPRYEIEYFNMNSGPDKLPETFDKYLLKKGGEYQPASQYAGYRFINQKLKH